MRPPVTASCRSASAAAARRRTVTAAVVLRRPATKLYKAFGNESASAAAAASAASRRMTTTTAHYCDNSSHHLLLPNHIIAAEGPPPPPARPSSLVQALVADAAAPAATQQWQQRRHPNSRQQEEMLINASECFPLSRRWSSVFVLSKQQRNGGRTGCSCSCCCFSSSTARSTRTNRRSSDTTYSGKDSVSSSAWSVDSRTGIVFDNKKATDVTPAYQVIVGFEIHVQLRTDHPTDKLFSSYLEGSGRPRRLALHKPNQKFHPFDAAVPGYLPLLQGGNGRVHGATLMEKAAMAALLCHSDIQQVSRFERKHYYYADLPHGYQITQQRWPLAMGGFVPMSAMEDDDVDVGGTDDDQHAACRIERIQLEMDTAKTTAAATGAEASWIDLDRAGMPLLEIVTKPDVRSPLQAIRVVQHLHALLTRCRITRGRMEHGEFRMDVNVNLESLTTCQRSHRVEIKNLNSFSHVHQSIVYEAMRQANEWQDHHQDDATSSSQETRTWDAALERTVLLRSKDTAQEYRFVPEPDLPPLQITSKFVDRVRSMIPGLPNETRQRLVQQYGIPKYQAGILVQEVSAVDAVQLFEETCRHLVAARPVGQEDVKTPTTESSSVSAKVATTVANLIANELFALLQRSTTSEFDRDAAGEEDEGLSPVQAWQLSEIVSMLHEGIISLAIAKKVLSLVVASQANPSAASARAGASLSSDAAATSSPRQLVQDMGWQLVGDRDELLEICRRVLEDHPKQAAEYAACEMEVSPTNSKDAGKARRNQQRLLKLFMGKAMSASRGNAHPERLQEALQDALEEMVSTTTTPK